MTVCTHTTHVYIHDLVTESYGVCACVGRSMMLNAFVKFSMWLGGSPVIPTASVELGAADKATIPVLYSLTDSLSKARCCTGASCIYMYNGMGYLLSSMGVFPNTILVYQSTHPVHLQQHRLLFNAALIHEGLSN